MKLARIFGVQRWTVVMVHRQPQIGTVLVVLLICNTLTVATDVITDTNEPLSALFYWASLRVKWMHT